MNLTWIIGLVLGVGGIGGTVAAVLMATGGLAVPAVALAAIPWLRGVWAFLNSTLGHWLMAVCFGVALYLGGLVHGQHLERAKCDARIQASIEEAKKFDAALQAEMAGKAKQQQADADERVRQAEQKVVDYEQSHKSCEVGDDAADWLNDAPGGVRPQGRVLAHPPQPPRRP